MKYSLFPEACRVCLRKSASSRSIFKPIDDDDIPPNAKLKLVTGVDVVENGSDVLPKYICKSCEISLNMAISLRNRARKSEQIIRTYCNYNRPYSDNIIVELENGRQFKLPKDLSLKVVKKETPKPPPLPVPFCMEKQLEYLVNEEHFHTARELISDPIEIDNYVIEKSEIKGEDEEDSLKESIENNANNCVDEASSSDNLVPDDEDQKPLKQYNAEEIAKKLKASNKYEVVSWKQDPDGDSVPVFKLRLKPPKNSVEYICEICGNTYNQKCRLMKHIKRHNPEKSDACEICNKRFTTSEGLRRHILTHGAQKPYKCNFCSRRFYTPSARTAHEKVHSGAKPYVCVICKRAFAYSCSLQKHKLIHYNIKLYRCDYCDKEFRLQHHLKQHEETQIHKDAVASKET